MKLIDADALEQEWVKGCAEECACCIYSDEHLRIDKCRCKLITNAKTINDWISVKERLPSEHDSLFANHPHLSKHMWAKESDDVIVYIVFPDGTGRTTEGRLRDGKWHTKLSPVLEPVITHWMPLPEPPEVNADA